MRESGGRFRWFVSSTKIKWLFLVLVKLFLSFNRIKPLIPPIPPIPQTCLFAPWLPCQLRTTLRHAGRGGSEAFFQLQRGLNGP